MSQALRELFVRGSMENGRCVDELDPKLTGYDEFATDPTANMGVKAPTPRPAGLLQNPVSTSAPPPRKVRRAQ